MSFHQLKLPENISYICVEGVIGVGKTSLCKVMEKVFNGKAILENGDANPFLSDFYKNRQSNAFQTQVWFLLSRYRQLTDNFSQHDLFHQVTIADYLFAKDALFASINLEEHELQLYRTIAETLKKQLYKPDFVIYLQASTEVLMHRIEKRNRSYEQGITRSYIERLNQEYNHFFFHYKDSPLLIVNSDESDFANNREDFNELIDHIHLTKWGSTYFNPLSKKEKLRLNERKDG
ncbi:MAG: deoxynucleoside kinase [Chitinivibrionales bacterium]|nr:deoxynucleoside kinase [Chitinivibrionales bacterium]